mgnify:FL=1
MNFVISTNEHPTYRAFLEPVCSYYYSLGHNVHVAYVSQSFPTERPECSSFIHIPLLDGFDWGIQAKLSRTFYASKLNDNETYTILDVDQILINIRWLEGLIEKHSSSLLSECPVLAIGSKGYLNTPAAGKWPLYFTTATPEGFRKLLGITKDFSFSNLLSHFSSVNSPIDNKESTSNQFCNFSDESLFRWCSENNVVDLIHEPKPNHTDGKWAHRIDRTDWIMENFGNPHFGLGFWGQKDLTLEQKKMIMNGDMYDSFPARPYEDNKDLIDSIISAAKLFNS